MLGEEWLCNSQLGYAELTEEEKSAVAGFAIVWSVFEAKVMASLEASDKDSLNILRIGDYVENKANHLQNIDSLRVSVLLCMTDLAHASKLKEHDDNDDFQGTTGRAA